MKIYFAHSFYDRERLREIELRIEEELHLDIFNPFYDDPLRSAFISSADIHGRQALQFGADDSLTDDECKDYVQNTLIHIKECDMVLVVPGVNQHEVQFCMISGRILNKKISLITTQYRECPWYRHYSDYLFHDWGAFIEYMAFLEGHS